MNFTEMLQIARASMTPEQKEENLRRSKERIEEFNKSMIEKYRCGYCKVDTLNYSHTFQCLMRGM